MGVNAFRGSLVAAAFGAMAFSGAANASLITNGSFENITNFVDNTGQDTMRVPQGNSTDMPGWTATGQPGRTADIAWIGPTNPFGLSASSGSYFLDLTGYQDTGPYGGVEQTIKTIAGATYQLTFDLGSDSTSGTPAGITASAGSNSQNFSFAPVIRNQWQTETMQFVALGGATLVSLIGDTPNNTIYIGLDNVNVDFVSGPTGATPLPAALPLFAAGLGAMGFLAKRRKRKNVAGLAAT